jgi:hypothetical protein
MESLRPLGASLLAALSSTDFALQKTKQGATKTRHEQGMSKAIAEP